MDRAPAFASASAAAALFSLSALSIALCRAACFVTLDATLGSALKASSIRSTASSACLAVSLCFSACLALLTSERVTPLAASLVCSTHCSPYRSFNLAIVSEFLALAAIPSFISAT